jgi:hypothetical protein
MKNVGAAQLKSKSNLMAMMIRTHQCRSRSTHTYTHIRIHTLLSPACSSPSPLLLLLLRGPLDIPVRIHQVARPEYFIHGRVGRNEIESQNEHISKKSPPPFL